VGPPNCGESLLHIKLWKYDTGANSGSNAVYFIVGECEIKVYGQQYR
jgi:hypothetical protein